MNPISGAQITSLDVECMDDLYPSDVTSNSDPEPTGSPDLIINNCGNISIVNNTVTLSDLQIINNGNAATSRNSRVGIYVSSDNTINTSDRLITTIAVPVLAAGSGSVLNLSFNSSSIPSMCSG